MGKEEGITIKKSAQDFNVNLQKKKKISFRSLSLFTVWAV